MARPATPDQNIRSTTQKRDDKGHVRNGAEWLAIWSDPESLKTSAEKRAENSANQSLKEASEGIAAAFRSLACKPELDVRFAPSGGDGAAQVTLPPIEPDFTNLAAVRGVADFKAGFLLHHDPDVHLVQPDSPDSARLLMLLEHCRCTALLARKAPRVTQNLIAAHKDKLERASLFEAHLASLIPLAEAVQMVARDSFHGATEPSLQTAGFRM